MTKKDHKCKRCKSDNDNPWQECDDCIINKYTET
jgi:hypothetical protein